MSVVVDATAPSWAHALGQSINRELALLKIVGSVKSIAKASLPTNGSVNIAIVPDATGGSTLAHFDPAHKVWRKPDGTVVS